MLLWGIFVFNDIFPQNTNQESILTNTKKNTILNNANKKITYFNRIGIHYEVVYHYVIRRREETDKIYNKRFLDDIVAGLISFDMQRMMGKEKYSAEGKNSWAERLQSVL